MNMCKDCIYWEKVGAWQGTCRKHAWNKPRWSQSANANGCPDYIDKSNPRLYDPNKYDYLKEEEQSDREKDTANTTS